MSKKTSYGGDDPMAAEQARRLSPSPIGHSPPQAAPSLLTDFQRGIGARRSLAETAHALWEQSKWTELASLDTTELEREAERASIALLLAVAHSQVGDPEEARSLAKKALLWGCSRTTVSRILLSSAHYSLARAAAALKEDSGGHLVAAIRLARPHVNVASQVRIDRVRELARMGLLPDAVETVLEEIRGLEPSHVDGESLGQIAEQLYQLRKSIGTHSETNAAQPTAHASVAPSDATARNRSVGAYGTLSSRRLANFRYLDVKSLPRTGLHFMRNTLESILRNDFSFCEWYTEPGCCKKMPCAVTGYATENQDRPMVRMIKSHDFDLSDPVFPAEGPIRRLILIRDPLYLMTSWWALQTLYLQAELLKRHGILLNKISFAHDPHVMSAAYNIIDAAAEMPSAEVLADWLRSKAPYVVDFVSKWQEIARADNGTQVIRYRETPEAILSALSEISSALDDETNTRLNAFRDQRASVFVERTSPFKVRSKRISAYMSENALIFEATAQEIIDNDNTGLLASA